MCVHARRAGLARQDARRQSRRGLARLGANGARDLETDASDTALARDACRGRAPNAGTGGGADDNRQSIHPLGGPCVRTRSARQRPVRHLHFGYIRDRRLAGPRRAYPFRAPQRQGAGTRGQRNRHCRAQSRDASHERWRALPARSTAALSHMARCFAGRGTMTATRIAHLTDLHFGAEDPSVVAALLDELKAEPPDLVAISGDLTQGARLSEFRAARAFIDKLPAPSLAVPGNHDISPYNLLERFTDPYARWRRAISPDTSPTWSNGRVAVLGLNSARRMGLHWDWSRGRVTRLRLARLLARLDSLPADLVKVVVMHHPLVAPEAAPATPVVFGAAGALRALALRNVRLVLAGHLHRGFARLASQSRDANGRQAPDARCGAQAPAVRQQPQRRPELRARPRARPAGDA